jgi:hypothetical protein
MAEDMDEALNGPDGAISKVEAFQKAFYEEMEKVWNETDKVISKVQALITEYGKLAEAAGKDYTPEKKPPETTNGEKGSTENGDTQSENEDTGTENEDVDLDTDVTIAKFDGALNTQTGEWQYVQLSNGYWYDGSHVKGKKVGDIVNGYGAWKIVDYQKP